MVDKPLVRLRALSSAVGWVRARAKQMGASLVGATYQSKNAVLDGFIVTAKRSGRISTVTILDTSALLAVPSELVWRGSSDPRHCPVIDVVDGRDGLLNRTNRQVKTPDPRHIGTAATDFITIGAVRFSPEIINSRSRPSMNSVPAIGITHVRPLLYTEGMWDTSTTAFMSRDDNVVYVLDVLSPTMWATSFEVRKGYGWLASFAGKNRTPASVIVSDSVMTGVLPFCKRVAPPAYDPGSSAATSYDGAQNIWMRAVSAGIVGGVHTLFVVAHAVFDMTDDTDRFGARGLWVAKVAVDESDPAAPAGSIVWQTTYDMRVSGDPRSAPSTVSGVYVLNNVQPAMVCRLATGGLVVMTASDCEQKGYAVDPNVYQVFNTVSAYIVDPATGAITRSVPIGPALSNTDLNLPMQPNDCAYPVGADTDGSAVYSVYFSTDSVRQLGYPPTTNPSLNVVRTTAAGATVVLSTTTPYRACYFAGTSVTECVRYIGNNKYLFVASNVIGLSGVTTTGDMCALVYDSVTNTVTFVGTIDATVQRAPSLIIGRMDCPVAERVDDLGTITRKATVLVTTGGKAQAASEPGGEIGKTYISYDSGATWAVLATYGSPAGVQYCGTQLITRTTEL